MPHPTNQPSGNDDRAQTPVNADQPANHNDAPSRVQSPSQDQAPNQGPNQGQAQPNGSTEPPAPQQAPPAPPQQPAPAAAQPAPAAPGQPGPSNLPPTDRPTPQPREQSPKTGATGPTLDQATLDQANAAMEAATKGVETGPHHGIEQPPSQSPKTGAAQAQPGAPGQPAAAPPKKKRIRGPRVVQGGREHRRGRVVSVGPADVFLEFGPKELGLVPRQQYGEDNLPTVGDVIEVVVDRYNANESLYVCSRPGAVQKAAWEQLQPGQVVEARVTGTNKGGLEMEVAQHRAFMPASQVDLARIPDLSVFVGEKLQCQVQKVERAGKGNIVLSRRAVLEKEAEEQKSKLRETLEKGQTVEGTVRRLMEFGAFVEIAPGVDGLVHVSDLAHERVNKPEDVVQIGQKVTVKVLKIDWGRDRISLGLKQTQADPYQSVASEMNEGDVISGKVTKIMEFGAFVEVAQGVEGLVHISELDWKRVRRVEDVVKPDQVVQVKVLGIDTDKRRVSLSIKQTKQAPADAADTRSMDQVLADSPAARRMKEKAAGKIKKKGLKSGLGGDGSMGMGLGDLKLPG